MAQYPANIDLGSLDGSNGFKLSGAAAHDEIGYSVASAGDVNGDGFADLFVGARGADPHGPDSGAGYVVFGRASGFAANFDLSGLSGGNGFKLSGVAAGDWTGSSVASAGDVNGDGFADLIVGAREADANGDLSGASYVVFGKASGFAATLDLSSLDGSTGFKLSGVAAGDRAGESVASAGDVNGDGFADLIVGAFLADPHGSDSGASYVVFGKSSGFAATLDLASLDGSTGFKLSGRAKDDRSGSSVSSAGDVNGDGFADLIVGAALANPNGSDSGASYVVFGKASGFAANLDLSSLDGSNGFRLGGEAEGDRSGYFVASAGDVNADGFADLIVGAMGADPHGSYSGASYVVFGKASGFAAKTDLSSLDGSNGFKLSGAAAGDQSGFSVASAGDVNGDGFADLIVGARQADGNGVYEAGASYVVFGKASGFAANLDLSSLDGSNGFKLSGVAAGDQSGFSVASAGDVNGDGLGDLIVGAWGADPHGDRSGASYVIYGRAPDTAVNRIGTSASQTMAGGAFDDILSGLGGDDRLFGNAGDDGLFGDAGNDTLDGGLGDDTASGGDGKDILRGREGNDVLSGGAGDDELLGAQGKDALDGGSGNDTLAGGEGNDRLDGGDGVDTAHYISASAGVTVDLALAVAQDTGGAGIDTLQTVENVTGSRFRDRLWGTEGANVLTGGEGDDVLIGRKGDDRLDGGAGADSLDGGKGNDLYIVDNSGDVVVADAGGVDTVQASVSCTLGANLENLTLVGTADLDGTGNGAANTIIGNGGVNILSGLDGNDVVSGEDGNDTLDGGLGDDTASGGDGKDILRGREGNDVLSGGRGDDELLGAEGNDIIDGGSGNDLIAGGEGNDGLDGSDGVDTARYVSASAGVAVDLALTGAQDTGGAGIDTLQNIENVTGSDFGDRLSGTEGANVLTGGEGDDVLIGREGDDVLEGGAGADRLTGGPGANRLTGGVGNDSFVFDSALVAGTITTVTDLSAGADTIALARAVFTEVGSVGPLAAKRFVIGAAADDSNDRIIYNSASGALLYDPDGTGSQAATQFATVTPGLALTAGDFTIV